MRIAFYAPLKSPTHGTPSGDRRVAVGAERLRERVELVLVVVDGAGEIVHLGLVGGSACSVVRGLRLREVGLRQ